MNQLFFFLIFVFAMLDAMRDGFRADSYLVVSNKQWHWIKRLGWYPLMAFLAWQCDGWYFVFSPLQGWLGWRFGLLWTPRKWDSMWFAKAHLLWIKFKMWYNK